MSSTKLLKMIHRLKCKCYNYKTSRRKEIKVLCDYGIWKDFLYNYYKHET